VQIVRQSLARRMEMIQKQAQEREDRHRARNLPDTFDMLMVLPYALVPPNELQEMMRKAKEMVAAAEQRRVKEKVNTWARQTEANPNNSCLPIEILFPVLSQYLYVNYSSWVRRDYFCTLSFILFVFGFLPRGKDLKWSNVHSRKKRKKK